MVTYIIKFVSADGLVRYEEHSGGRPNDYIERKAVIGRMAASFDVMPLEPSLWYIRRLYKLRNHGVHPETGKFMFEYEEQL